MAEEKKHELLALHDIQVLGETLESLPEHPSTRMFYEPQYFKIEHQSPLALFGYILPLEAIGPAQGPQIAESVTAVYGPKCASFVKLHAGEDVEHLGGGRRALDRPPSRRLPTTGSWSSKSAGPIVGASRPQRLPPSSST